MEPLQEKFVRSSCQNILLELAGMIGPVCLCGFPVGYTQHRSGSWKTWRCLLSFRIRRLTFTALFPAPELHMQTLCFVSDFWSLTSCSSPIHTGNQSLDVRTSRFIHQSYCIHELGNSPTVSTSKSKSLTHSGYCSPCSFVIPRYLLPHVTLSSI
jgi:hypothetical protein